MTRITSIFVYDKEVYKIAIKRWRIAAPGVGYPHLRDDHELQDTSRLSEDCIICHEEHTSGTSPSTVHHACDLRFDRESTLSLEPLLYVVQQATTRAYGHSSMRHALASRSTRGSTVSEHPRDTLGRAGRARRETK